MKSLSLACKLLVAAFATWSVAPALADPTAAYPDEVIDLSGVVDLTFNPDDATFSPFAGFLERSTDQHFTLTINQAGTILDCTSADNSLPEAFVTLGCDAMRDQAKITVFPGYDMAGNLGLFSVGFQSFSDIEREAILPIEFVKPDSDVRVSLILGPPSKWFVNGCFASNFAGDPFMTSASFDRACELFLTMTPKERKRKCVDEGERLGEHAYRCSVRTRKLPDAKLPEVSAHYRSLQSDGKPAWNPISAKAQAAMYDGKAALSVALQYPGAALRDQVEGVTQILVGFNQTGRIVSCRPFSSAGTAFIDNSTCKQVLQKGEVVLANGSWEGDDPRYLRQAVRWTFPD